MLTPESLKRDDGLRSHLTDLAPDAIPVVAYGNLIPADMLDIPTHGWVNLHFSLLPQWRGAAPVQAAIRNGDTTTGATTFRIDEGLDTGEVLGTITDDIAPTDTADDVLTRLAYAGADLLVHTMDGLEAGTLQPAAQPAEGTYAPKISTADARVNWVDPAAVIDRTVRAYTPGPGAWTMLDGQRYKIGPVTPTDTANLAPGQAAFAKNAVLVGTGEGDVQLGSIQAPGKKMMAAADWARGLSEDVRKDVVFE